MKDYKILVLLILVCFSQGDYTKKNDNSSDSSLLDKHTIFPDTISEDTNEEKDSEVIPDTTSEETNKEDDSKSLPTVAPYIPRTIQKETPTLILLGFGNFERPYDHTELIIFKVYFKRIHGTITSEFLMIPLVINYISRLRQLYEIYSDCRRITNYNNSYDIIYNCSAPIRKDSYHFNVSTDGEGLMFNYLDEEEEVNYILSSRAKLTKNSIQLETSSDLEDGVIILDETVLYQNETYFTLTGHSTEDIIDSKVTLYLDKNGNGNSTNLICDIQSLKNIYYEKLGINYMIECHPNQRIRAHFQWVSGKTNSNKNIIISFLDENEDLIDIDSNNDFNTIKSNKSSSSKLSGGAIAGIVIGSIFGVIGIIVLIVCCYRKNDVSTVEYSNSQDS